MTFAVGMVFFVMYGVLTDRNDRMAYGDQGIILYTVWGKAIAYDWSRIIKVDTAVEQLRERRFVVGLVLRICVKERNGEMTTYRFPYKHYTGLNEFLAFSNCRSKK